MDCRFNVGGVTRSYKKLISPFGSYVELLDNNNDDEDEDEDDGVFMAVERFGNDNRLFGVSVKYSDD